MMTVANRRGGKIEGGGGSTKISESGGVKNITVVNFSRQAQAIWSLLRGIHDVIFVSSDNRKKSARPLPITAISKRQSQSISFTAIRAGEMGVSNKGWLINVPSEL
jgi:hypothetical protein